MADELEKSLEQALREAFDQPLAAIRQELTQRLLQELAAAREAAAEEAARSGHAAAAEALNLGVRRIRHAISVTEVGNALLEAATSYCGRAALMVYQGQIIAGWRAAGFVQNGNAFSESWARFQMPIDSAPALAQAIETRDPVVSLTLPGHLSPALVELLGLEPGQRAYLFPLCFRQRVVAILYADALGSSNGVLPAALELLCSVAEAYIEVLSARASRPSPLAPGETAAEPPQPPPAPPITYPKAPEWDTLSPAERDLHLRAQRFARVLVADLQLYRAQAIREGRKARNLYGRLKEEIDKSREAYYRKFAELVDAGVDYFHLELVRSLADNQEELLGPDYPGPMTTTLFSRVCGV